MASVKISRDICASPFGYQTIQTIVAKELKFPQESHALEKENFGTCASKRRNLPSGNIVLYVFDNDDPGETGAGSIMPCDGQGHTLTRAAYLWILLALCLNLTRRWTQRSSDSFVSLPSVVPLTEPPFSAFPHDLFLVVGLLRMGR